MDEQDKAPTKAQNMQATCARECEDEEIDVSSCGFEAILKSIGMLVLVFGIVFGFTALLDLIIPEKSDDYCFYERSTGYVSRISDDTVFERVFVDCPQEN